MKQRTQALQDSADTRRSVLKQPLGESGVEGTAASHSFFTGGFRMRGMTGSLLVAALLLAAPATAQAQTCGANTAALGVARTVEIDTAQGPGFGFEHFKEHDFLEKGEVILTFDDGPWPVNTPAVLEALAKHCTKATFFPVGQHAIWHPQILKEVAAQGHTIGGHTWSHKVLMKAPADKATNEIEMGFSAVSRAAAVPTAPFFRFPALQHPPEMVAYLGKRNIAIFSTDLDSFDFKTRSPETVVKNVMSKLAKNGKGIVLLHDFQPATAKALPKLLDAMKKGGYRVVHMKSKAPLKTLPDYDEKVLSELKTPGANPARPTKSVVRTITGATREEVEEKK